MEIGERYGRLVVTGLTPGSGRGKGSKQSRATCTCDCGGTWEGIRCSLVQGRTRSCGCLNDESRSRRGAAQFLGHGYTAKGNRHPLYSKWVGMRQRCRDAGGKDYKNYGGRGIRVCSRWDSSFENFVADMGSYPKGMSLDRIDVNGDYCPANCRWATSSEQNRNRRRVSDPRSITTEQLIAELSRRIDTPLTIKSAAPQGVVHTDA